jgi:hypothetical protein
MPVITCPKGHRLQVTDRHIGQVVKCPTCQSSFVAEAGGGSFEFDENDRGEDKGSERPSREGSERPSRGGKGLLQGYSVWVWLINSFVGKPLLFVGLLLVILGRGCDATGMRSVSRTDAHYRQAKVAFQLEWDAKLSGAQQKIDKKNRQISEAFESKEKGDDLQKRLTELQKEKSALDKELSRLRSDQSSALAENENGTWKPLREAALKASNSHRMSIFWYEWLFIFGTVVLVLGVLTVAFTGQGAERWIAYIMIAIITFSIYVGGAAWIESILSSTGTGAPVERPGPLPPR